jgi:PAS domain S-box-containing protein
MMDEAYISEPTPHKILIVDDFEANLRLLADMLSFAGYQTIQTTSGTKTLDLLEHELPSMILLDIMMPEMDGFTLCKKIKENPHTSHIPIIFISALDDHESKINGFIQGGVDYITKPFRKQEVLARIKTQLQIFDLQKELHIQNKKLQLEIKHHRQTELRLKESEEKHRSLFQNNVVATLLTQPDGTVLAANNAACTLFQMSEEEICKAGRAYLADLTDARLKPLLEQRLKTGRAQGIIRMRKKDRTLFEAEVASELFTDSNGIVKTTLIIQDRTDQLKTEDDLRTSENRYNAFLNASIDPTFVKDNHGRYIMTNNALASFFEKNVEDLIGKTDSELAEDGKIYPCQSSDIRALQATEPFTIEERLGERVFETTKFPLKLKDNKIGIGGIMHDITNRKKNEEQIQSQNNKLNAIIESLPDLIFISDGDGKYLEFFNPKNKRLLFPSDNLIGSYLHDVFKPDVAQFQLEKIRECLQTQKPLTYEYSTEINGKTIHFEGRIVYMEPNKVMRLVRDITRRKQMEEKLIEDKKLLRTLIDNLPVTIYVKDIEGRKVIANKTDVEVMGQHSEQDVLGKTDLEIFQNEIGQRGYNDDMNVIHKQEAVLNRVESFLAPDGSYRWLLTTKIPLFDQHGKVKGLVGIGRDITEQKLAQETIKKERQLLRTLIDNIPFAIYIKDKEGRKLVANAADLKLMYCQNEADIIGKTDEEIFDTAPEKGGYIEDMNVLNTGLPLINKENKYLDPDGTEHWRVISKFPIRDENNQITGLVGIGRDITEQKKANTTIQKLTLSIEQSPSVVVITDTDGVIEYVNPSFTQVTGYKPEEAIGRTPNFLKSGQTPQETYQKLWNTITQGMIWRGELYNRKKNGTFYWEWSIITSLKNEQGHITNYIAIKEDISWRKQLESDLISAKEKAEENDRLKSAFLANMSHEIRTPLNSILGFAELLADPDMQDDLEQRMEFAKLIMSSGTNLLHIINDIVDISKIEAGQVVLNIAPFTAQTIVTEVWNENKYRAQEKGLELIISEQMPTSPIELNSDALKLKQVLINFIGNAIKFTEKGSIELGISLEPKHATFYVKDTGIGIVPEAHERIFERFLQIEGAATRKYGGNGLGLAISKSLIEMLGGNIGMKSEFGKGSTFYFNIPIEPK